MQKQDNFNFHLTCTDSLMKPIVLFFRRQTSGRNSLKGRFSQLSQQESYCGSYSLRKEFFLLPLAKCLFIVLPPAKKMFGPTISIPVNMLNYEENSFQWAENSKTTCYLTCKAIRTPTGCWTLSKCQLCCSSHMPIKMFPLSCECTIEFLLFFCNNSIFFLQISCQIQNSSCKMFDGIQNLFCSKPAIKSRILF